MLLCGAYNNTSTSFNSSQHIIVRKHRDIQTEPKPNTLTDP